MTCLLALEVTSSRWFWRVVSRIQLACIFCYLVWVTLACREKGTFHWMWFVYSGDCLIIWLHILWQFPHFANHSTLPAGENDYTVDYLFSCSFVLIYVLTGPFIPTLFYYDLPLELPLKLTCWAETTSIPRIANKMYIMHMYHQQVFARSCFIRGNGGVTSKL